MSAQDPAAAYIESMKVVPEMAEICLNVPLYQSFPFEKPKHASKIRAIRYFRGHFDTHCLGCQRQSTFHRYAKDVIYDDDVTCADGVFSHEFACTREGAHKLLFIFRIEKFTLTKIGQFPSIADISKGEIDRYRKPLGSSRFFEFNRAIGLAAHGVGIGAFVYLRRVFEFLIDDAYQIAKKQSDWDEATYQKNRVVERIELLAAHLPPFLVEHRRLYGIMSKGVHSLSEAECLEAFPVIRVAIELILDQRIEALQREEKLATIKKSLGALDQKLKEEKG